MNLKAQNTIKKFLKETITLEIHRKERIRFSVQNTEFYYISVN